MVLNPSPATYIATYITTCMRNYLHTCIRTYLHTACVATYIATADINNLCMRLDCWDLDRELLPASVQRP